MKGLDKDCVFCKKIKSGDYMASNERCVAFTPLNPVTEGHLLVIPKVHTADFTENQQVSAETMAYASELAALFYGEDVNLITSKGKLATQSINHLHIHIVPRRKDDGLMLPWSAQAVQEALAKQLDNINQHLIDFPKSKNVFDSPDLIKRSEFSAYLQDLIKGGK
jgi:histidine triad (HIT) family protein